MRGKRHAWKKCSETHWSGTSNTVEVIAQQYPMTQHPTQQLTEAKLASAADHQQLTGLSSGHSNVVPPPGAGPVCLLGHLQRRCRGRACAA